MHKIVPALVAALLATACQPLPERVSTTHDTVVLNGVTMSSIASPPPAGARLTGAAAGTLLLAALPPDTADRMDPSDRAYIQRAIIQAYNGASASWKNPTTQDEGVVTPSASSYTPQGRPCREFRHRAVLRGQEHDTQVQACQQPDGTWARVAS